MGRPKRENTRLSNIEEYYERRLFVFCDGVVVRAFVLPVDWFNHDFTNTHLCLRTRMCKDEIVVRQAKWLHLPTHPSRYSVTLRKTANLFSPSIELSTLLTHLLFLFLLIGWSGSSSFLLGTHGQCGGCGSFDRRGSIWSRCKG